MKQINKKYDVGRMLKDLKNETIEKAGLTEKNIQSAFQKFVDPISYKYLYKTRELVYGQPQFIEYLDASSNIYIEYYTEMIRRMEYYPYLSYVFLTNNTNEEIQMFLLKFPIFQQILNIIYYSYDIKQKITIKDIPYCIIVDNQNKMLYHGATKTEMYASQMSYLNQLSRQQFNVHTFKNIISKKQVSVTNYSLSLLLSNLKKETTHTPIIHQSDNKLNNCFNSITFSVQLPKQITRSQSGRKSSYDTIQRSVSAKFNNLEFSQSSKMIKQKLEDNNLPTFQLYKNRMAKKFFDTNTNATLKDKFIDETLDYLE